MYGIFISGSATIGKNCVLFQQVTIGSNTLPMSKGRGAPGIGDNCYIGAGAKIIGGIRIGDNCRIGANCVVVDDVADNSLVVMPKPKIIQKEGLNNKYYSYRSDRGWIYRDGDEEVEEKDPVTIDALGNLRID